MLECSLPEGLHQLHDWALFDRVLVREQRHKPQRPTHAGTGRTHTVSAKRGAAAGARRGGGAVGG
eukprot:1139149-Alexandrium_andersonii.AAC.2